jgi:hypothetical protein
VSCCASQLLTTEIRVWDVECQLAARPTSVATGIENRQVFADQPVLPLRFFATCALCVEKSARQGASLSPKRAVGDSPA